MTVPCVLFLAVPFGATKADMNLINFGHTVRIYAKRQKGVLKNFVVRIPICMPLAGQRVSIGPPKALEAALQLRDEAEKQLQQGPAPGTGPGAAEGQRC